MTTSTRHAATPYPAPADLPHVTVVVTYHNVKTGTEYNVLTGEASQLRIERMTLEATPDGRSFPDRYRVDDMLGRDRVTIWHDHGNGSSSSLSERPASTADVPGIVERHSAAVEDPCYDGYQQAWTLGRDLTAKVHTRAFGTTTDCGRDLSGGMRVLRASVDEEQYCGSCRRSY